MNAHLYSDIEPNTPILVGVGLTTQRREDALDAKEPIELMIDAANAAGDDCGAAQLLQKIDRISVPVGRWQYGNPGGLIATAIGASGALSIRAIPGVSQQTLLSDACGAIASGEIKTALVIGGEAGYRLLRAKIAGVHLEDTVSDDSPDIELTPHEEMWPDYERQTGLGDMPVGYYAIVDSAFRHARGYSTASYRDRIASRYSGFSHIAARNVHAWNQRHVDAEFIRNGSTGNRMLAFPYTKLHNSQWNIDQGSALLFTSVAQAEALGIPREKWVFPQVFTEANHMVNVTARGQLDRCVGAQLAGRAAFETAACLPHELDFLELYTCFPVAVESYAYETGVPESIDWSFTGAMPFAGGPFNSFVLHAVGQMAQHIRRKAHSRGLVTTVSGIITKQGFGIWGADPNPDGYQFVDVTSAVAAATERREVVPAYVGPSQVAGYTVLHDHGGAQRGIVVVDLPDGRRSIACTEDPELMSAMQAEEYCGARVNLNNGWFTR